ncbi:MAG: hypothetical protein FWD86_00220 [Firmicutes bacterium]|nr:hypothetical protein [Bacillota bacterium]
MKNSKVLICQQCRLGHVAVSLYVNKEGERVFVCHDCYSRYKLQVISDRLKEKNQKMLEQSQINGQNQSQNQDFFYGQNQSQFNAKNQNSDIFSPQNFANNPKDACLLCGTLFESIKKTLFVGCQDCYDQLFDKLIMLIDKVQYSIVHTGLSPNQN